GQSVELSTGTQRFTLPNGLVVVVKEDHRLPTVTATLAYRVGSADDPPGQSGLAHFLEHMVFKGTQTFRRGEIDLVTFRSGGENNAYTTFDLTGYWFHVGSSHLDDVLEILSDTMGRCTLDPREFEIERGPILEEMNIWLDGPWGELDRRLDETVYTQGRYRHPILGSREDVERLTRDQLKAHYETYYTPDKADLVLVGDVDPKAARGRVERFFGAIPRGRDDPPPAPPEGPQVAPRNVDAKTEFSTDRLLLGYRTPPEGTPAALTLDVLATLLGEGRFSKLKTRLVLQEELATEEGVTVTNDSRRTDGLFTIQVVVGQGGSVEKARTAIQEELEALVAWPVTDRELRRAKNLIRTRMAFDLGSQKELAWRIGTYEALGLPDYLSTYLDRIEAVTPEEVQAVAEKTFAPRNRTAVLGKGSHRSSPPRMRAGGTGRPGSRRGGSGVGAGSGSLPSLGEVREERLPNGMTIIAQRRSDLPILTLQAGTLTGSLYESEDKAGLADLVSRMLDQGIQEGKGPKKTSDDITREVEFLGGQYTISSTGISVNLMSAHATVGFDLLRDLLRNPSFPEDRFERMREDQLADLDAQDEEPQDAARRLFYESAFRGHPFERPASGRKETVQKLTLEDVRGFYRRFYRPENVIVAAVGDLDPARALRELRDRFESWKGDGPWTPPRAVPALRQTESRTIHHASSARQARIHLGHVGIERSHPDFYALRVMEVILGASPGFTSRLARRVRDEMGLCYDISGTITDGAGLAAGPFQVVLGVDPKKGDQALEAVLDVLRRFQNEGPTEGELRDAKAYLLGSFASSWETIEDTASYLVTTRRYGLGADYPTQFQSAIAGVTREDVLRVAREHLDLGRLTTVVVGGRSPWVYVGASSVGALLLAGVILYRRRRRNRSPVAA
ncbi:MAG TPA: pitrilysin family protein, partial [Planctomycetota bacterium]|nr:pitrilysin family protein [Planctomycetota bacterium]